MGISHISEFMSSEEIFEAWDELAYLIDTLRVAIYNRLAEDNITEDDDDDDYNEEQRRLVELRNTLCEIDI